MIRHQQQKLTGKTWGVTFYTDDPTSPPTPDDHDVAADIQVAQAGLMASDDMIHRIADGITHQLDSAQIDRDSHLWLQGIYAGGDRNAGVTQYSNAIFQDSRSVAIFPPS